MLHTEIPMDSLMALAQERRRRYTAEAERFRLARSLVRARRARRARRAAAEASGTRVTAGERDLCA